MILGSIQSAAFQVERLAAALLIARNIGGDPLPPPPPGSQQARAPAAASPGIAGAETADLPPEAGNTEADGRADAPPSQSLLGLRTPASLGDRAAADAMRRLLSDWSNGMAARNASDGSAGPANTGSSALPGFGSEAAAQRRMDAGLPPPVVMPSVAAAQSSPPARPATTADESAPDAEPADAPQSGARADASRSVAPSGAAAMAAILLAEADDIDFGSSTAAPDARPSDVGGSPMAAGAGAMNDTASPLPAEDGESADVGLAGAAAGNGAADSSAKASAARADIAADASLDAEKLAKAPADLLPVEDSADSLALRIGLFAAAGEATPQQVERAGVIASFILNAAMIPGWPPPRPFVSVEVEELMTRLQKGPVAANELEVMTYLSKFGLSQELLAKIFALMEAIRRRRLVMLALAILLTNARAVLESIKAELARLTEESESAEAGVVAPSGRHHLSLR